MAVEGHVGRQTRSGFRKRGRLVDLISGFMSFDHFLGWRFFIDFWNFGRFFGVLDEIDLKP